MLLSGFRQPVPYRAPPGRRTPRLAPAPTVGHQAEGGGRTVASVDLPVERAVVPDDVVVERSGLEKAPRMLRIRSGFRVVEHRLEGAAVRARDDAGRLRRGPARGVAVEGRAHGGRAVVVGDGVVDDEHPGAVLQRDAAAGQPGHVVHDDVVVEVDAVPGADAVVPPSDQDVRAVDELGADAAAVAGAGQVALDQVGQHVARRRRLRSARSAAMGAAPPMKMPPPLTVHPLVEGLVEQDGVVGDGAAVAQAEVADAAAVARREVAADGVLADLVAVGPGVEGRCRRRPR